MHNAMVLQSRINSAFVVSILLNVSGKNRPFPGQEMIKPAQKDTTDSMTDPFSGIRIM